MTQNDGMLTSTVKKHGEKMRFPKLFVLILVLFVLDLLLPDMVPFIDEILLGLLAVVLGLVKEKVRGA